MRRKWDADVVRNLTKRGQTYYYRTDFKDSTGKRHAFRRSLHTSDFYTAVGLLKNIKKQGLGMIKDKIIEELWKNMPQVEPGMTQAEILEVEKQQREIYATIARRMSLAYKPLVFTPEEAWARFYSDNAKSNNVGTQPVSDNNAPVQIATQLTAAPTAVQPEQPKKQHGMTIEEMANAFIVWKNVDKVEQKREHTWISNFAKSAGVKMKDDFSAICSEEAVTKIVEGIKATSNQHKWKRKNISFLKNLFDYAEGTARVRYHVVGKSAIKKLPRQVHKEGIGHLPFSTEELKKLFSPQNTYFDEEPDYFWAFLIALYTGARSNAAGTLQYKDVRLECDIPCIEYIDDHPAKKLKTTETERVVPIAQQFLELGFFDMVAERKKRLNATDTDFILRGCMTSTDKLSSHFSEKVKNILTEAGIKSKKKNEKGNLIHDGKSFHSCRNTLSVKLDDVGIKESIVNKIIGWSGGSTRKKYYLKRELAEIAEALKSCRYDEIWSDLQYWATRIREREAKFSTSIS